MTTLHAVDAASLARACRTSETVAGHWLLPIKSACQTWGIDTLGRLAHFLAQIGHESGSLRYTSEVWGPTPAQLSYEGRKNLGNTQPGDGERYKGHGLIQVTGRFNHAQCRDGLRAAGLECPDFEQDPEALTQPIWAAHSAGWYWHSRNINELADRDDIEAVTRKINGGLNGFEDRKARLLVARAALADLMPQQDAEPPLVQLGPEKAETSDTPDTSVNSQGELIVKEKPMAPFITAVLPALFEAVPALVRQFGSGSKMAERNAQAVDILVGTAKKAAQAVNEQDLAEKLKDPGVAAAVRQAVEANWIQIVEVGGGVDAARKADAVAMASGERFWRSSPSFWIAVALLPLVYMIVANVVGVLGTPLSDEVRSAISNGVVGLILGGLIGYYYGQSTSRNRPGVVP